jgi:putative FmdB family regulatory protein
MAYYEYRCEACEHFFGEELSIKKYKRRKKCPSCGKHKLNRVLDVPTLVIKGRPTTIGQLAEANTKKMGRYERQEKENRDNKELRKAKKEARKSQRDINSMTKEQKKKYILEGD